LTANCAVAATPDDYLVTPRPVSLIEPGTVVEEKAPKGWSHLIIRSHPRVADEELSKVNAITARHASLLFTAMTAKVEQYRDDAETKYRIKDVGVGFGAPIGRRLTILSPDTQAELGANLSFVGSQVLATCYEEQKAGRVVCQGDTMAIVDTYVVLNREGRHRWCAFRHAMLIDARNGALATLLWPIDLDESARRYVGPAGPVEWLAPNKIEDSILRVDSNQITFGFPSKTAFAVDHMPRGERRFDFPSPEVGKLLSLQQMSPDAAHKSEAWLWKMVHLTLERESGASR
jgi:hypothetical protein